MARVEELKWRLLATNRSEILKMLYYKETKNLQIYMWVRNEMEIENWKFKDTLKFVGC